MSMFRRSLRGGGVAALAALFAILATLSASAREAKVPEGPNLGQPATPEQIAGWNISVAPDGKGLPPGKGTAALGSKIYIQRCAICHGMNGEGSSAQELVGGIGSLATKEPTLTIGSYWPYATTLFDYIRRAMPPEAPLSLTSDEVYSLCAYLLFLNGIISKDDEMNAKTLTAIHMPNRNGFIRIYHGLHHKAH